MRGPTDAGSAMYFLGDGWTHISIMSGFYFYGLAANNRRAEKTGYALMEGLSTVGITTQIIKRTTGRESPFVATAPRGVWRFFPDISDYNHNVAHYDAFPTGHLATAMMTVTVVSEMYPEKKYIKPLGYGLMSLLAFQMVNNGVHWISDYPLGMAMGYSLGKLAVKRANGKFSDSSKKNRSQSYPLL